MNAKQSLKIVSQKLKDAEATILQAEADIKLYNKCIDTMISGGSPCPFCEEYDVCQFEAKDGKGCSEWWLTFNEGAGADAADPQQDDSQDELARELEGRIETK